MPDIPLRMSFIGTYIVTRCHCLAEKVWKPTFKPKQQTQAYGYTSAQKSSSCPTRLLLKPEARGTLQQIMADGKESAHGSYPDLRKTDSAKNPFIFGRQPTLIVFRVRMERIQKRCGANQYAAGPQNAESLGQCLFRFGQMFQHFGKKHHIKRSVRHRHALGRSKVIGLRRGINIDVLPTLHSFQWRTKTASFIFFLAANVQNASMPRRTSQKCIQVPTAAGGVRKFRFSIVRYDFYRNKDF